MRKVASGLMVLILILLFGATFYCSIQTEKIFKAQLEQLNQDYQGVFQLELSDYQRSLLLSDAQVVLQVQNEEPLPLVFQLRHFPWGVTINTSLAADSVVAQRLAEVMPLEELQLVTDIDLTGLSQTRFSLPDIAFSDDTGSLSIKGLAFFCNLNQQMTSGDVSFELDSLQITDEQQTALLLSGINLSSQFIEQQGLPLGDGEFVLEQLSVNNAGQSEPEFELKGLHYQAATELDGEKLSSDLTMTLAELSLLNEKFTVAELKLAIAGIDVVAVRNIQESAKQLQADMLGQEVDPVVLQLQLFGLYSQLFREGISLTLERLAVQTDEGAVQGHGVVKLQDVSGSGASPGSFEQLQADFQLDLDRGAFAAIFRVIDALQRNGKAAPNRAVLTEQAGQLAGAFVQKGILIPREGGYRSELSIDNGNAELNGRPFSF